jgi:hypothetical protein
MPFDEPFKRTGSIAGREGFEQLSVARLDVGQAAH